jgi:hypothetical protein
LYHPLLSGPRSGLPRTPGGVESFLTLTVDVVDPSMLEAVHETAVPPVSFEIVVLPQAGQLQETVTDDRCHAKQLEGAGEHVATGAGGGALPAEPVSASTQSTAGTSASDSARVVMV